MKKFNTLVIVCIFSLLSPLVSAHEITTHSKSAYVIVDVYKADYSPDFGDCTTKKCTVRNANESWEISIDDVNNVRLGTAKLQKINNSGLYQAKIYLPDAYLKHVGQTAQFQHLLVTWPIKGYVHFASCAADRICLPISSDDARPHL